MTSSVSPFYLEGLNPAQKEAVQTLDGPCLVVAGAGSGKTRVLIHRTAALVDRGDDPSGILLLTFTRRAAREMVERAQRLSDERCRSVWAGTFHAFAFFLLRRYGRFLQRPWPLTVMDAGDAEQALARVQKLMGVGRKHDRFPKAKTVQKWLSAALNKGVDVEDILWCEAPAWLECVEEIRRWAVLYDQYKRRMGLLDYDDLLIEALRILDDHESVRHELGRRFHHVMVDEYQDTNHLQAKLSARLVESHGNIMAVGDDRQSIYSFRGADVAHILNFPRMFPGTKIILLEENYRSTQPILDLTNALIRSSPEGYEKSLFSRKEGCLRPIYIETEDEHAQSRCVVRHIEELLARGVPAREIAVLFRSGWHSNDLEVALTQTGISFVKYGGQRFVEAAHVKDVLAVVRVLHNPSDEPAWRRLLGLLPGVGVRTIDRLVAEGLCDPVRWSSLTSSRCAAVKEMLSFLDEERGRPRPLDALIDHVVGMLQPHLQNRYDDFDKRMWDLVSLRSLAQRYADPADFLADTALDPLEEDIDATQHEEDPVVLSTIHSAKGLEWNTVFIIFVADGYLPHHRCIGDPKAVEEERRLFYVAATRAKERLFLLRPLKDSGARAAVFGSSWTTRMCRFLMETESFDRYADMIRL